MGAWLTKAQTAHRNCANEEVATYQVVQTHATGKEVTSALSSIERMAVITNELIQCLCLDKCNVPLAGVRREGAAAKSVTVALKTAAR